MVEKYKTIVELYNETIKRVTASQDRWLSFLQTACNNYRLPFDEQLLVHAQRPEATAVLTTMHWNRRFGRWVKPKSKGIAIFDKEADRMRLKYYFDILDTQESRYPELVRTVPLWTIETKHHAEIIETLEDHFGALSQKDSLEQAIKSAVGIAAMDNYSDYLFDLMLVKGVCTLATLKEVEMAEIFRGLIEMSVGYMVLERCQGGGDQGVDRSIFHNLAYFSTPEAVNILGSATCKIAMMVLTPIAAVVRSQQREALKNGRSVAKRLETPYNEHQEKQLNERSDNDDHNLQQTGRLPVAGSDGGRRSDPDTGEIRIFEKAIFDGTPLRLVSESLDTGTIERSSKRDSEDRHETTGTDNNPDDGGTGHYRSPQSPESHGMGGTGEYHQRGSGGTDSTGIDLQLNEQHTEGTALFGFQNNVAGFERVQHKQNVKRHQYPMEADQMVTGSPKERYRANISAIKQLKQCETENRLASSEEQRVMARYIGWGGLPDVFDAEQKAWTNEYHELKNLLNEEEYVAARASILTAFFTPPVVIKAMYQVLENSGFREGNLLEPACGIGHFIGMQPSSMEKVKLYGVELDILSGRIARQLYQQSRIAIKGFEQTDLPDSFFDAAIGNVPFGAFQVRDSRYDKQHFHIHDYFFAKTLDKIRPGGIIAFITSKGTMDKSNSSVRRYIAERANLIAAIRLPDNTFKASAGTEVTSDILFLQKRDRLVLEEPQWIALNRDEKGIVLNAYFTAHPEMILGEMVMVSGPFGEESHCKAIEGISLEEQLKNVIHYVQATIKGYEPGAADSLEDGEQGSIPADPSVRNFSYTLSDAQIYYRENSQMRRVVASKTAENRIKGMITIREVTRTLIAIQTDDYPENAITAWQNKLNTVYDVYVKKYGHLTERGNRMAFSEDGSYPLLCSLEILDDEGRFVRKADMFSKRTIKVHTTITHVDTAQEALAVSLSEKACVDMAYMKALSGKSVAALVQALTGSIFEEPMPERGQSERQYEPHYVSADAYLSGNVREKLKAAIVASRVSDRFKPNIEALEKAQPKDLMASEITVRLGATWIPEKDIEVFMFDLLSTPRYMIWNIHVHFLPFNAEWHIEGKNRDNANLKVSSTYGTTRKNAYQIIEETLNLKDVKIFDYREDAEGKKKAVLNRKETTIAQEKQEQIKAAFKEWVWEDPERRARITAYYNDHFNAIRPREYDGSVLNFYGMNPEIALRPHQKNAVARIIYGGNTLLAHVVGSGKTFTMITAAMEMKRIGLCQKSMVVVPNHIVSQFAAEWMLLYPSANILVTSKKDFETKKRQKFCAKIATGDYDGVIIGHSQFGKIPLSTKWQQLFLKRQIDEITDSIVEAKRQQGERFTIKQMEKTRKTLEMRMEKLNDQRQKDDVVTFEQLGIDRLFVDEADEFKNLYLYTKMRNVGGIAQTEAQKSSDLFMKTQYIDELTGGKGTIFATGTPISNSMVELYTLQRYLQYDVLKKAGLQHFDAWASTFGETVSAIELAPEGTGYRMKTRFAHFYNLPELMTLFKEVADIQTADQLALPVPKVNYQVIKTNPSTFQKEMVENLAERAEAIRKSAVDPAVDNMLCITNDGRKLALDQRLSNAQLPDDLGSKVNACIEKAYQFWWDGKDEKLTQILFCDLSTPKKDAGFNVYDDIRDKLVKRGIPLEEIRFIHEADSEIKKKELFGKVRKGSVRILLGSTAKLGAGTNIQDRLIALHDLDCPWRPRDLEQRAGRIVRQGNRNPEVNILRYVTEGTFDSYSYQLIENKQRFIAQIMTSKTPVRSAEDIDASVLSYAEIKALATGNPLIKEKMDLDISVSQLQLLKQSYLSQKYNLEDKILKYYPQRIIGLREKAAGISVDIQVVKDNKKNDKQAAMTLLGVTYNERSEAGKALLHICKTMTSPEKVDIGHYRGFDMALEYKKTAGCFRIILKHTFSYSVELGASAHGNIERIDHRLDGLKVKLNDIQLELETLKKQCETAKIEVQKPFTKEEELVDKMARLNVLNASLNHDEKDSQLIDAEPEAVERSPPKTKEKVR